ncbi:MAG: hypothetical protein JO269_11280 [Burkholderiaceae bacterium]|nr:hypothetical protein [Burkholderiaceae bacterium]
MPTIRETLAPQVQRNAKTFFLFPALCVIIVCLIGYPALQLAGLVMMFLVTLYTWRQRDRIRCPHCGDKLGKSFNPPSKGPQLLQEMEVCPHCRISLDAEVEAGSEPAGN